MTDPWRPQPEGEPTPSGEGAGHVSGEALGEAAGQSPGWPPPPAYDPPPAQQPYGQQPYGGAGYPPPPGYGYPGGAAPYGPGGVQPAGPGGVVPTSGRATTVMVLGIVSLVTLVTCGLGFIPAIIALVLAGGADREIRASGGHLQGAGQVKAGRIMAWVTIGLTILGLAVVIGVVALAVSAGDSSTTVDFGLPL